MVMLLYLPELLNVVVLPLKDKEPLFGKPDGADTLENGCCVDAAYLAPVILANPLVLIAVLGSPPTPTAASPLICALPLIVMAFALVLFVLTVRGGKRVVGCGGFAVTQGVIRVGGLPLRVILPFTPIAFMNGDCQPNHAWTVLWVLSRLHVPTPLASKR